MAAKVARCGFCKTDFTLISRAVEHVMTHKPKARRGEKAPIWMVRYDRSGGIAEIVAGPRPTPEMGVQIERGEGTKTAFYGSESGSGVSGDGHVSLGWWNTPCLCSCHFGKPACDTKGCS